MSGKRRRHESKAIDSWGDLETIAARLRGIAHLLEAHRPHDPPIDVEEVQWGIGLILSDLSAQIKAIWISLDEAQARATSNKARKGS